MSDDVVVNFSIGGGPLSSFAFGTPLLFVEHEIGDNRQAGPFTAPDELVDFGFTVADPAYLWALALMSQRPRPQKFMIGKRLAADIDMLASITAVAAEGPASWHTSFLATRDPADQLALATWTASQAVKFAVLQNDGTGDLSGLINGGFHNTAMIHHPENDEFLDGAWGGRCLGADLDEVQGKWSHQGGPGNVLSGIPGTNLTAAAKAALSDDNINYYAPKAMSSGVAVDPYTFPGVTLSGGFIEQEFSLQWFLSRLEEALHEPFFNADGVSFDDDGFAQFETKATGVFGRALSIGHLVQRRDQVSNRLTPFLDVVGLENVSPTDEGLARVRMSGVVHIGKKARRVVLNVTANLGA
jgi:hypothetical protein